jgi:SanA protein
MKIKQLPALVVVLFTTWITVLSIHMNSYNEYIVQEALIPTQVDAAVVLGTVIKDEIPPLQRERLDLAIQLYNESAIDRIIVSNTEQAAKKMTEYLLEKGIPSEAFEVDGAAVMTSDTCNYLAEVGGSYVLITQQFHLKRSLYLCRQAGVDAYGYAAENANTVERTNSISSYSTRAYRAVREQILMSLHLAGLYK